MYTLGIQLERKRLKEVEELAEKKARERLADEMAAQYEQAQEEKPVPPKPDDTGADTCPSYAIEVTTEDDTEERKKKEAEEQAEEDRKVQEALQNDLRRHELGNMMTGCRHAGMNVLCLDLEVT